MRDALRLPQFWFFSMRPFPLATDHRGTTSRHGAAHTPRAQNVSPQGVLQHVQRAAALGARLAWQRAGKIDVPVLPIEFDGDIAEAPGGLLQVIEEHFLFVWRSRGKEDHPAIKRYPSNALHQIRTPRSS